MAVLRFLFAWGAFVFLPVNVLAGAALAKQVPPLSFALSLAFGLLMLSLSVFPAAMIASKTGASFSRAMLSLLPGALGSAAVGIVPFVNMGWFAIQLAMLGLVTQEIIPAVTPEICILSWGIISALGPLVFGYRWLSLTGALALAIALAIVVLQLQAVTPEVAAERIPSNYPTWHMILTASWTVYGTWAFSSSSCVMDLARFSRPAIPTALTAILGLFVADITLMGLGYLLAHTGKNYDAILALSALPFSVAYVFFVAGLWSTNDSNIYSTKVAVYNMGLKSWFWPWLFVGVATAFAIIFQDRLFTWIGHWLILMGWIAVPLTAWWWYVLASNKITLIASDVGL